MLQITKLFYLGLIFAMGFNSCNKDVQKPSLFTEETIELPGYRLTTYSYIQNTAYLIIFETGLGDDHSIWEQQKVASEIAKTVDVLLYDRAGYGKSETGNQPRNIDKLRYELEIVIDNYAKGRKVILVGHSLGGMIIRDYAIKNPSKTAALLFVDASHEMYNNPSQQEEDLIYNAFRKAYGENSGAAQEASQLIEDSQYMSTLPNLPDIPVIAITSMKTDREHSAADRQLWYNSKEAFKTGITDFTHITTTESGHYIMVEQPDLVMDNLRLLLSKLL